MMFHEIYGSYYQTVAHVLRAAVDHPLAPNELKEIIRQKEDYNPQLVNSAEKVLIARMTGTEIIVNKQNTDNMNGQ